MKTARCAAHDDACALAGGSKYVSEFCEAATEPTKQELELRQLLADAAEAEPNDARPLRPAERDAQYRDVLTRAAADVAAAEAAILSGGVA